MVRKEGITGNAIKSTPTPINWWGQKLLEIKQNPTQSVPSKEESAFSTTEPPPKRVCRSQVQSFNIEKCIICQKDKVKKNRASARTREPLTQNISEYGSASLLKAAQIRDDERVLLHIKGQDTIALEVKYHRSCYKEYVHQETLSKLEDQNCQNEDSTTTSYQGAFDCLSAYVQNEIISSAKVITMSQL